MSKIHEALKKIQQDRATVLPSAEPEVLLPMSTPAPSPESFGKVLAELVTEEHKKRDTQTRDVGAPMVSRGVNQGREPARAQASLEVLRQEDLEAQCIRSQWHLDCNRIVFCGNNSCAYGAEQFRTLRARLLRMRDNQTLKKLQITSAISGEGKTFIASNLANAFAGQGARNVLLIDGDLRNPGVHAPIGAPVVPGLSDYLRGEVNEPEVVQHGLDGSLYLIAAGTTVKNPGELLSNGRLKTLLTKLGPLFDWVVIDSPPCLPVADASLISAVVDAVVLVVRATSTPAELSRRACKELQGRNLVGVVLNGVEEGDSYYGHYSYEYGGAEQSPGEKRSEASTVGPD